MLFFSDGLLIQIYQGRILNLSRGHFQKWRIEEQEKYGFNLLKFALNLHPSFIFAFTGFLMYLKTNKDWHIYRTKKDQGGTCQSRSDILIFFWPLKFHSIQLVRLKPGLFIQTSTSLPPLQLPHGPGFFRLSSWPLPNVCPLKKRDGAKDCAKF